VLLSIFRSCNREIRSPSGQDISTNTQYFFIYFLFFVKYILVSQTEFESILSSSKKDNDDHIFSGQFQVISVTHQNVFFLQGILHRSHIFAGLSMTI
jgi:hypothetical protein